MKFSCDRCGKKYATAETPAPGRVYKLKCKACGHVIVVKTPASAPAPGEPSSAQPRSTPPPVAPQVEVDLDVEIPPAGSAEIPLPTSTPVPSYSSEPTAEISMMNPEVATPRPAPPQETGYVDIFADSAPAAPPAVADDPFLKAARGSLPEHFGGPEGAADPFADMRDELGEPARAEPKANPPPEPRLPPVPPEFAAPPPPRADDRKKSNLPVALIGVGIAAVLGIVVVVALTSGKKAESAPERPAAQVALPAPPPPPPPPAPEPAPAVEAKRVEPEKAVPKPEPKKREERREERKVARAEPKPEPKARPAPPPPPPPPPPVARAEPEKPVRLPDAATALSPEAVQRVVNASRKAFEGCIVDAARRGGDTKFDGRKVALRLNVNPNGFVTYPTLDDVTLNRTDLGECLKSAARLMVFPKFQGDVFHVEVPLTLRGG